MLAVGTCIEVGCMEKISFIYFSLVKAVRVVETLHNDGVRWSPESDKGMNIRKKTKFKNLNLKLSGTSKGTSKDWPNL